MRNEHLVYLCGLLERLELFEELLNVINKMMTVDRVNPFPYKSFLIENRAYYDSSNHLKELKEKIENKLNNPSIDLKSVKFEFK